MNILKLSFLFVLALSLFACNNDDDNDEATCTQADWVGAYTSTLNCDGVEEMVTVTVAASGSENIQITYESPSQTTEYDGLKPDGCNLDVSQTDSGLTLTVNATLDGDKMSLTEVISGGSITTNCAIEATRN